MRDKNSVTASSPRLPLVAARRSVRRSSRSALQPTDHVLYVLRSNGVAAAAGVAGRVVSQGEAGQPMRRDRADRKKRKCQLVSWLVPT